MRRDRRIVRERLRVGVLLLAVLCIADAPAEAQVDAARIAVLGPAEEPRFSEVLGGLRRGLRDHGYLAEAAEIIEGKVARGDAAGARAKVEGFLRRRVAVLFVIGSELARLARQVSADLPIVFITPGDPVVAGLVASLARPGGNTTGMTFEYPELSAKRLELLQALSPAMRKVVVLYDPRDASPTQGIAAAREGAAKLGLALVERQTRSRDDVMRGLQALGEADALLAIPGGITSAFYAEVIRAANAARLPTMFHSRTATTADALACYGASDAETARQAARLVDKIVRGEKAGELPVERPTRLELTINLRTAQAIGLTVPPALLARADEVIE